MLIIQLLAAEAARRWRLVRATKDAGTTTETVVLIALLVALAIAVIAALAPKVLGKVSSINLGAGPGL